MQQPEVDTLNKKLYFCINKNNLTLSKRSFSQLKVGEVIAEVAEMDSFNWGYDPVACCKVWTCNTKKRQLSWLSLTQTQTDNHVYVHVCITVHFEHEYTIMHLVFSIAFIPIQHVAQLSDDPKT